MYKIILTENQLILSFLLHAVPKYPSLQKQYADFFSGLYPQAPLPLHTISLCNGQSIGQAYSDLTESEYFQPSVISTVAVLGNVLLIAEQYKLISNLLAYTPLSPCL